MFVFSADWHLSYNTWARYPDLTGDSYYGLRQIVDYCLKHKLPLIAAGDLFDKPSPDPLSVNVMCRNMDLMEEAGLPVYFIQGQHERTKRDMASAEEGVTSEWLGVHTWPTHVHGQSFTIGDYKFYGLDWTPIDRIDDAMQGIPSDTDVLVCHQVWREFMGEMIQTEYSMDKVPHVQCILTGDFHEHTAVDFCDEVLDPANQAEHTTEMFSPGSISMRTIAEPVDKYFYRVEEGLKGELVPMSKPLRSRSVAKWEINTEADLDEFVEMEGGKARLEAEAHALPEELRKPIIHVRYCDVLEDVYARITAAAESFSHLFMSALKTANNEELLLDEEARRNVLDGGLEESLRLIIDQDDPIYGTVLRLLTSSDPEAELRLMHREAINVVHNS